MTIYLGNISYDATESQIFDLFSPFGTVFDINYPVDRITGKQRGFAFVTIPDREAGQKAIQSVDGADLDGRPLRAKEAEAPERPEKAAPLGFRKHGENPFGGGQRRR